MSVSPCEVGLNTADCEWPPGREDRGGVTTRCHECGKRACRACSAFVPAARRKVGGRSHRRCNDCAGNYQGNKS